MSASRTTGFDSGERNRAELALRESEERFGKIVDQAPIAMAVVGMDGAIEFINRKAVEVFGYTSQDIPTMERWWAQAYPNEQYRNEVIGAWMPLVHKAVQDGSEIPGHEYRVTCKDGSVKTMVISGACIAGKVFVLFDDITKRKQAEVELRESNEKFANVFRTSPDAITVTRLSDGVYLEVNQSFTDTTGYLPEEVLGRSTLSSGLSFWVNVGDRDQLVAGLKAHGKVVGLEVPLRMKDGGIRTVLVSARVLDIKGQECILAVTRDITERKWAEAAVAEEKERLAVTLRSIGDGVITTDTGGAIINMNRVAEDLTGWIQSEAEGKPLGSVFAIVHETTRAPCASPVEKVLSTGAIVELESHALLTARDGTERLVSDSAAPITDREGKTIGVVLVFRDMTEKQRALEVMQRAARLDSLGILAGGIAHDFNNLLTGIFGYVELARARTRDAQTLDYLDGTLAAMNRAKALSMQLLTFAKGGAPAQKATQVIPLIREAVQFALSGANVSCQFSLPEDLWACHIDRNQIAQVIDNIVINAQQAMPNGGVVEVAARNVLASEGRLAALAKGNYVKVSITDHGVGMPKEVMPRIFDPFYTTKSKGHGLGLATCYSIVSRHGGRIDVESAPNKGSTFHVYLPASVEGSTAK